MVLDLPRTVCPHAHRGRDSADAGQGVRRAPRLRRRQAHCGGARGDAQGQSCCDLQWVRYLQQVRLAVREREPGERRDHYRLYDDTWYEAVTQRDEMLRRWQEDMREGIGAVGADTPARATFVLALVQALMLSSSSGSYHTSIGAPRARGVAGHFGDSPARTQKISLFDQYDGFSSPGSLAAVMQECAS